MEYTLLGNTGLKVTRTAFGALPIQRRTMEDAIKILRCAYDGGINFFDTARMYSNSEEKIGNALKDVRKDIVIATKTASKSVEGIKADLETSLRLLQTDYVDLFQFHNFYPSEELIDTVRGFIRDGKVRCMGLTLHAKEQAIQAIESKQFKTLQFPLSSLSDDEDVALTKRCEEAGMGFIAMKAMAGGLIRNVPANFAFIRSLSNVVPIWGIQHMHELEEFLTLEEKSPQLTEADLKSIHDDKIALGERFCRGCGYCMPCPADLILWMVCRMDLLLGRSVYQNNISKKWQDEMAKIDNCTDCRICAERCPYHLKPYEMIRYQQKFYNNFLAEHRAEIV